MTIQRELYYHVQLKALIIKRIIRTSEQYFSLILLLNEYTDDVRIISLITSILECNVVC